MNTTAPTLVGTLTLDADYTHRFQGETACNFEEVRFHAGQHSITRRKVRGETRYTIEMHGVVVASFERSRMGGYTSDAVDRAVGAPFVYAPSFTSADLASSVRDGRTLFGGTVAFHDAAHFEIVPRRPHAGYIKFVELQLAKALAAGDADRIDYWQPVVNAVHRPGPRVLFAIDAE